MEQSLRASEVTPPPRQLTGRAALTFVSNLLQQGARIAVQFFVTPILIRGLGLPLYGAWMLIQQTIGYLAVGDIRPMATLKLLLAAQQHTPDEDEKRRLIGAALRLWLYTFPMLLVLGAGAVWLAPRYIHLSAADFPPLRIAMGIAVLSLILDRLLSLPSNVLAGMNLDYRAMGLSTASVLSTGVLTVIAVRAGFGLPGVAVAAALGTMIYNAGRFFVARGAISWLGVRRPARGEVRDFARASGWVSLAGAGSLVMMSSDLVVVGIILGPTAAAIYGTTASVLRILSSPIGELISASSPGVAGLCGREDWSRIRAVRTEMYLLTIVVMAVVGTGAIALNQRFLPLWTKHDVYAGTLVNATLVVMALLSLLYRTDRNIVLGLMEFRAQAIGLTIIGAAGVLASIVAGRYFGMAGVALATALAYVGVLMQLHVIIRRRSNDRAGIALWTVVRAMGVTVAMYAAAIWFADFLAPSGWFVLGMQVVATGLAALVTIVFAGLTRADRARLRARIDQVIAGARRKV